MFRCLDSASSGFPVLGLARNRANPAPSPRNLSVTTYQSYIEFEQTQKIIKDAAWDQFEACLNDFRDRSSLNAQDCLKLKNFIVSASGERQNFRLAFEKLFSKNNLNSFRAIEFIKKISADSYIFEGSFNNYLKQLQDNSFDWEACYSNADLVAEYKADFARLGRPLLPCELHIIALIFDLKINFQTENFQDVFNENGQTEISIKFSNNHFERVEGNRAFPTYGADDCAFHAIFGKKTVKGGNLVYFSGDVADLRARCIRQMNDPRVVAVRNEAIQAWIMELSDTQDQSNPILAPDTPVLDSQYDDISTQPFSATADAELMKFPGQIAILSDSDTSSNCLPKKRKIVDSEEECSVSEYATSDEDVREPFFKKSRTESLAISRLTDENNSLREKNATLEELVRAQFTIISTLLNGHRR